jgi:hypothetical protein
MKKRMMPLLAAIVLSLSVCTAAQTRPAFGTRSTQDRWVRFAPAGHCFEVSLPEVPEMQITRPVNYGPGFSKALFGWAVESETGSKYALFYLDLPAQARTAHREVFEAMIDELPGRLLGQRFGAASDLPVAISVHEQADGLALYAMHVMIGRRYYVLINENEKDETGLAQAVRFFDSFKPQCR